MILKIKNFEFMKDFALKSEHEKTSGEERTRREKEEERGGGGEEEERVTDRCKLNRKRVQMKSEKSVSKSSETDDPEFLTQRKWIYHQLPPGGT